MTILGDRFLQGLDDFEAPVLLPEDRLLGLIALDQIAQHHAGTGENRQQPADQRHQPETDAHWCLLIPVLHRPPKHCMTRRNGLCI